MPLTIANVRCWRFSLFQGGDAIKILAPAKDHASVSLRPHGWLACAVPHKRTHPVRLRHIRSVTSGDFTTDQQAQESSVIDRAFSVMNTLLEEICQQMLVEEAAKYVTNDESEPALSDVVKSVVAAHIDRLDSHFLAALNAYIEVIRAEHDDLLVETLKLIREEVMLQVSLRLPTPARILDVALLKVDKDARVEILRHALNGGGDGLPGSTLDALAAATSQFIDDMEEKMVVPDRRLLARLCLVKEELRYLDMEMSPDQPCEYFGFYRTNVSQRCAAFVKELLALNDGARRESLLEKALASDWDGAAPKKKPRSLMDQGPDYVRPGRLLTALEAVRAKLVTERELNGPLLHNVLQLKEQTMAVLDRLQRK